MKGKCKLCLRESDLRYSHIIPEYFYKPMYDSKHRFMQISTVQEYPTTFLQKGVREYLLCNRCEEQFSKYELDVTCNYGGISKGQDLDPTLEPLRRRNTVRVCKYYISSFGLFYP